MSFEIGFIFKTDSFNRNNRIENHLGTRSDFEILSFLGKGSSGRVYLVKHIQRDKK